MTTNFRSTSKTSQRHSTRSYRLMLATLACSSITILTGCPDNFKLKEDESFLLGSNQRALTNVSIKPTSRPGRPDPERIVCSEPSPDTAETLNKSISFAAELAKKGNVALSQSSAQAVIQLAERTTAIQALRDQMHRACEAYMNGAISGTTYTMIMNRNNDTMVTLMLGENAAGAFGRSGAATGGKTSSEARAKFEGATGSFKEALTAQTEAQTALDEAKEKLDLAKSER